MNCESLFQSRVKYREAMTLESGTLDTAYSLRVRRVKDPD